MSMKINKYAIASKLGFETFEQEVDFRKRMKELHQMKTSFTPRVLVEGLPDVAQAKWLDLNLYLRIQKKGGDSSG